MTTNIYEIAIEVANKLSVSLGCLCSALTINNTDSERMDLVNSVYKEVGQRQSEELYDFCMKDGRHLTCDHLADVLSGDKGNDVIQASGADKQPANEE